MTVDIVIDPDRIYPKEAVAEHLSARPPWDVEYDSYFSGFNDGFAYACGVLAVCAFLEDLAREYNMCPAYCDGGWMPPSTWGAMERECRQCGGTGKRVTP